MIRRIKNFIVTGDNRTVKAKKNIVGSMALKIIDVALDFILVPLSLAYLTQTDYGIWLTINSMVNWLNFFDIGISHGYRNKLAIALNNNDLSLAKAYTSTAYILIGVLSIIIAGFGILVIPHLNWSVILNTAGDDKEILSLVLLTVVITFAVRLTLKIITSIFLARQMPFLNNLINTIIKTITFLGVFILITFSNGNLLHYSLIVSVVPLFVLIFSSLFFFAKKYKAFKPSFSHFDKTKINDIMGLGLKFFVIQLGATMLFMTDNLIIAHVLTPADVTPYQIAFKYFGIVLVIFSIIIAPFWSAITDAYEKNDYSWIKKSIKSLNKIWAYCILLSLILLGLFYPVLSIWVGNDINVPLFLAIQWVLFVTLQSYNNIYTFFLNGTGKVYLQMITGISTLIINIPLSILFAKYLHMDSAGVLLATNCSIILYIVTRKIQYNKLINKRANGIWTR